METNDFLPQNYEAPKTGGNYMKLQKGENKFRILSKPIVGWEDWKDKKPLRYRMNDKPDKSVDSSKPMKHFWAFLVFNYAESQIQILEITQSSIQKAITNLIKDNDWGSPYGYDIKVVRTGDGMDTEYAINPVPHKKLPPEITDAYKNKPCDLEMLFGGEDPFKEPEIVTPIEASDLPF